MKNIIIAKKMSQIRVAFLVALIFSLALFKQTDFSHVSAVYAAGEEDDEDENGDSEDISNDLYQPDDTGFVDYSGDVDIYTGKPVIESEDKVSNSSFVSLKDGSSYDRENGMFVYTLENGTFSSSACDGMVLTDQVNLVVDGTYNVAMYCDGRRLDGIPAYVSEPGTYVVITWDNVSENQILTFQIVEKTTGRVNQYIIPQGFTVKTVYFNSELQKNSFGSVDMTKEGLYEITYTCSATGVDYFLNVSTDHTPPNVTFEGLDSDNKAKGPVTIRGLQQGDKVYVLRNDDESSKINSQNQITQDGRYHVTVVDSAGNSVSRDFVIMIYLNVKGVFFLSLIIVLIIALLIALYISRKRLRVR